MPIQLTRGDTFDRGGQFIVSSDGLNITDMTGWVGRSQVRTQTGELVEELTFEWLDATQRLFRLYSAGTDEWPVGTHIFDIRLTTPEGQSATGPKDTLVVGAGATQ